MAKLSIPPIPDGYSVQELPQQLYQPLTGGFGSMRLDYVGGAARLATFTWKTDRQGYETIRNFYEENIDQDCPLFQIDLVAHDNALVEYDAYFLPETFTLTGVSGHTYTCQAQAELQPETGESTSWPGTSFVLTLLPDESNYAIKNGEDVVGSRLHGPVGKYRRDQMNNARTVSCTWLCDATEYDYLQQCYRAWVAAGGRPFQMQLIMDDATPTTHRATFVPGTFGLASQGGTDSFAVNAQLEVEPTPRPEAEYALQVDPIPPVIAVGSEPWEITVSTPSIYFPEDNAVIDPITSLPVAAVFDEASVQAEHDYAADGPPSEGLWTWLGSAAGFFDAYSIDFTITAGISFDPADPDYHFPKFGVGRADDQGTTGGAGFYHAAGDLITTDVSDVLVDVIASITPPLVTGDVITVRVSSVALGAVAFYLNNVEIGSVTGRVADFFIRPYNQSAGG